MGKPITVVELSTFVRSAVKCFTAAELEDFKYFIASNPEAGARIQGTGGIRKVRWEAGGKGKRGGARVIYYYHDDRVPLFLLTVYRKSRKENLTAAERAELGQLARRLVATYGGRLDDV